MGVGGHQSFLHSHVDTYMRMCRSMCVGACVWVYTRRIMQARSLRRHHTPAGVGLAHLLCQVWVRARQSFSGSCKDSFAFRVFILKSGNTGLRAERPGEVQVSSKAPLSQVCSPKGRPWMGVGCSCVLDILSPAGGKTLAEPLNGLPRGTLLWAAHIDGPGAGFGGWGTSQPSKGTLLLSSLWIVTMCSEWGRLPLSSLSSPATMPEPGSAQNYS